MTNRFLNMSKIYNIIRVLTILLIIGACQSEEHEILTEEDQQSFSEDSEFFTLVERVSMNDGSQDDELDESPCFSISFPYRLMIQGVEIKIASADDLEEILENIEDSGMQEFSLQFPLTLTWSNYEIVNVSNMQELAKLKQECVKEITGKNAPITCVDIDFPIKLFTYNVNSQITSSANAANKKQLYIFLQNKNPNEVLSFDYPIELSFANDEEMEVNSNTEFAAALKTCNN